MLEILKKGSGASTDEIASIHFILEQQHVQIKNPREIPFSESQTFKGRKY